MKGKPLSDQEKERLQGLYVHQLKSLSDIARETGYSLRTLYRLSGERNKDGKTWEELRDDVAAVDMDIALLKYQRILCQLPAKIEKAMEHRQDIEEVSRHILNAKSLAAITKDMIDQAKTLSSLQIIESIPKLMKRFQESDLPQERIDILLFELQSVYESEFTKLEKA